MLQYADDDENQVWAGGYGVNGFVHVEPPRMHDRWTLVTKLSDLHGWT